MLLIVERNAYGAGVVNYWSTRVDAEKVKSMHVELLQFNSWLFLFRPLSGRLRHRKYFPLTYMSLTIELSVIDNAKDPLVSAITTYPTLDGTTVKITAANTCNDWSVMNVRDKCDLIAF